MWEPTYGAVLLSHTFAPTMAEHQKLLRSLWDCGFKEFQFPVADMSEEEICSFRTFCKSISARTSAIMAFIDSDESGACPISNDPAKRQKAEMQMIAAMKNADLLGATMICGPILCGLGKPASERTYLTDEQRQWRLEFLHRVNSLAKSYNLDVAIEGINRFESFQGPNDAQEVVGILEESGVSNRVGVLIDTFHQALARRNTHDVWRRVGPRIKAIHMSDMNRTDLGHGPAFPSSVMEAICDLRPSCALNLELWGSDYPKGIEGLLGLARPHSKDGLTLFREARLFLEDFFNRP